MFLPSKNDWYNFEIPPFCFILSQPFNVEQWLVGSLTGAVIS